MELAPPSYESATSVDIWNLVSTYVTHPHDLCAVSLVCRRWHKTFSPRLWGSPAVHFHNHWDSDDRVMTRFLLALPSARLEVRRLTHTLRFPSRKDLHDGLGTDWLRDVLHLLPNLQSLIVCGLPSFDHQTLQNLVATARRAGSNVQVTSFSLRLMEASHCQNLTSQSLADALPLFGNLLYLDLSFTQSAHDRGVLDSLKNLQGLQILKLRRVGLGDDNVGVLARAIKLRVRSLDVRDNRITDQGARTLLQECFLANDMDRGDSDRSRERPQVDMLHLSRSEDFEPYLLYTFTTTFADRLSIEDTAAQGLTHLYISGNSLTAGIVCEMAKTARLHVLDVGSLKKEYPAEPMYRSEPVHQTPGLALLPSVLLTYAATTLTLLRIDYNMAMMISPQPIADSAHTSKFALASLKTLILTGVPSSSTSEDIASSIINFICLCAAESQSAWTQAFSDYALPPGRRGNIAAVRQAAKQRFALTRIVLEVTSKHGIDGSTAKDFNAEDGETMLSMTEDRDSEAFWAASNADFSFFDKDDGSLSRDGPAYSSVSGGGTRMASGFDTIALVAAFRKDRKIAFERQQAASFDNHSPSTAGYWDGVVQVVRNAEVHPDHMNDYYSTRFVHKAGF